VDIHFTTGTLLSASLCIILKRPYGLADFTADHSQYNNIFYINSFHTGKCFRMLLQQKTEYLAHYAITLHDD
jgi:hypothetical protein